ncbi:MAG: YHYH protein [Candidatus Latescibacteria bacterium]|nr:YHYH protein [Candidatus Latescibacterota bacterium]
MPLPIILCLGLFAAPLYALENSADFTGDGQVDFDDLFALADNFGRAQEGTDSTTFDSRFDLTGDGRINFDDFFIFADAYSRDNLLQAFAPYADLVSATCDEDELFITSPTGLPAPVPAALWQRPMVGIEQWILRVPIPFQYTWRIPLEPQWSDQIVEASPRGPIAVAANGVPIFHYEARPDVSTHPEHYDPGSDTVVQGELDHCGGHAGQGDDYHYHYVPVCLLDDHDLDQPLAWGLDGAPIYFGTGGDQFYGQGQYNHLNRLPDEPLDLCNAVQQGDGYIHYTTAEPPYIVGCHHGVVDPSRQIEPRPMRPQGADAPYGGQVGEATTTLVTDWFVDEEGWYVLQHQAFTGQGTSAVHYRQTDGDCWEFDFRAEAQVPGTLQTHCR